MNTFLSGDELKDLADVVERYNDYFAELGMTLETTVVDANGEFVGYIRYDASNAAYVFADDLSVLD